MISPIAARTFVANFFCPACHNPGHARTHALGLTLFSLLLALLQAPNLHAQTSELSTYEPLELLSLNKQSSFVLCAAAIPNDDRFLLVGRHVTLWSVGKNKPDRVFEWKWVPNIFMQAMAVAPSGKWFVTADCMGKIYRFDLATGKLTNSKDVGTFGIMDMAISPSGKDIAVIHREKGKELLTTYDANWLTVKVKSSHDPANTKFSMGDVMPQVANEVEYLDNDHLLVRGLKPAVWQLAKGEIKRSTLNSESCATLGVLDDGKRFFMVGSDALSIWERASLRQEASVNTHIGSQQLIAFGPADRYFASLNEVSFSIFETQSHRCLQRMKVEIDRDNQSVGLFWIKNQSLLVSVEQHGLIRVWGTQTDGKRVGLKPVHTATSENFSVPATTFETQSVLDFGRLQTPIGTKKVNSSLTSFNCEAPVDFEEAVRFYRNHFQSTGWKEDEHTAETENDDARSLVFRKNGFRVIGSFTKNGVQSTRINFTYRGNYDVRMTPKLALADVSVETESEDSLVVTASADLLTIECELLRCMRKSGWVLFGLATGRHPIPFSDFDKVSQPERTFTFIKNGSILGVAIGHAGRGDMRYAIEYKHWLGEYSVPVPNTVNFIEYDQPNLGFTVLAFMKSADLKAFYDTELKRQGWVVVSNPPSPYQDSYQTNYALQQQSLQLVFRQHSGGLSSVFAYCGSNTHQMHRLIFKDAPEQDRWTAPVTRYCSYSHWLMAQKYEPGYDSIDRYEQEMKGILSTQSRPIRD